MNISNANFVFSKSYRYFGVYDRTVPLPQNSLNVGYVLNDGAQRYVSIKIQADGTLVTASVEAPVNPSQTFSYITQTNPPSSPPSDAWNSTTEFIVGTGDLRPGQVFHIDRHNLQNAGIVLSCPKAGELIVYIP